MGNIMRVSKEDTRSLDNGSCGWLSHFGSDFVIACV